MSYSASLYCNTRKLLQFLFLLTRRRLSWRCVSIWTIYKHWLLYVTWGLSFDSSTTAYLVLLWAVYFSDNKGVNTYTALSEWISSGFSFYCLKCFENITFKSMHNYTWKKNCFSLYIILRMILQLGGVGNVIAGIAGIIAAAAVAGSEFSNEGIENGKFDLWYQWRISEVSVTAWRILRKEKYKPHSY